MVLKMTFSHWQFAVSIENDFPVMTFPCSLELKNSILWRIVDQKNPIQQNAHYVSISVDSHDFNLQYWIKDLAVGKSQSICSKEMPGFTSPRMTSFTKPRPAVKCDQLLICPGTIDLLGCTSQCACWETGGWCWMLGRRLCHTGEDIGAGDGNLALLALFAVWFWPLFHLSEL